MLFGGVCVCVCVEGGGGGGMEDWFKPVSKRHPETSKTRTGMGTVYISESRYMLQLV